MAFFGGISNALCMSLLAKGALCMFNMFDACSILRTFKASVASVMSVMQSLGLWTSWVFVPCDLVRSRQVE